MLENSKLIQDLKGENNRAFGLLYEEHFHSVRNIILKHQGTEADAEDLFQDAMLVFLEKMRKDNFQPNASLKTYIVAICKYIWYKRKKEGDRFVSLETGQLNLKEVEEIIEEERTYLDILQSYLLRITDHCNRLIQDMFFANKSLHQIKTEYGYSTDHSAINQKHKCMEQIRKVKKQEQQTTRSYMKNSKLPLLFLATIFSMGVKAQTPEGSRLSTNADIAFRYGTGLASGSGSYLATFGLGKKRKFHLGGGLRLALASGSDLNFETAPARLTGKPSTIDSVEISSFTTYSMNLFLDAEYEVSKRLNLGFNIDLAGFSWGSRKNGVFISENSRQNITARPTPFNILLVGDNDIGSLNSELFVRFKWKQNISVRGGISYLFTEFQTDKKYSFNNDRFRNKSMGGFVSISFLLPGKK